MADKHLVGGLELVLERVEVPSELLVLLDADVLSAIAHRLPPDSPGAPGAATTSLRVSSGSAPAAIVRWADLRVPH